MDRKQLLIGMALVIAAAGSQASRAADAAGPQPGDPPRWYEPAETRAQKYKVAMKEAGAALQEALNECRALAADRKACEGAARATFRADVAEAKSQYGSPG
jgi:hypothetical protein